jgi:hypothetical protein
MGKFKMLQEEYTALDCSHHIWNMVTDTCFHCSKDAQTILSSSKPCCGGGISTTAQYANGKWHDKDCDTLKPPASVPGGLSGYIAQPDYRPQPTYGCQCGAGATSNPNCHSTWCPEWKK